MLAFSCTHLPLELRVVLLKESSELIALRRERCEFGLDGPHSPLEFAHARIVLERANFRGELVLLALDCRDARGRGAVRSNGLCGRRLRARQQTCDLLRLPVEEALHTRRLRARGRDLVRHVRRTALGLRFALLSCLECFTRVFGIALEFCDSNAVRIDIFGEDLRSDEDGGKGAE